MNSSIKNTSLTKRLKLLPPKVKSRVIIPITVILTYKGRLREFLVRVLIDNKVEVPVFSNAKALELGLQR